MKLYWNKLKIHVLCWTIYIVYELLVSFVFEVGEYNYATYTFFYILCIFIFYFHGDRVIPFFFRLSSKKRWWLIPLIIVLEQIVFLSLATLINYFLEFLGLRKTAFVFSFRYLVSALWRPFLFMLYGTGYFFLKRYITTAKEKAWQTVELEHLNTQLALLERDFLRAQTSPHLLFNTLSFVKYAAKNNPDHADEAIRRLSDILRFSIDRTKDGLISLEKEILQVENMVRINQLRFGDNLHLHYDSEVEDKTVKILPLVLITLVENLFKHGNMSNPQYPATISIESKDGFVTVETYNLINTGYLLQKEPSGSGLLSLQLRLEKYYNKENFTFRYGAEDKMFRVYLNMPYKTD